MRADFAQEIDIVELEQPIGVIDDDRRVFALEIDKPRHLLFETFDVVLHCLPRHEIAHVRAPRGVSDHARAAADQYDGLMPRLLHVVHGDELHKMPDVQRIRRRVETDIERHALFPQLFVEFVLENRLLDKAPRAKCVHNVCSHKKYSFVLLLFLFNVFPSRSGKQKRRSAHTQTVDPPLWVKTSSRFYVRQINARPQ